MNTRLFVAVAIALALAAAVAASVIAFTHRDKSGKPISLNQVRAAFARNGIPLPCVTEKGRSFTPCGGFDLIIGTKKAPIPAKSRLLAIASSRIRHLAKYRVDESTFRVVEVWDSPESAASILRIGPTDKDRIVVNNVVYFGLKTAAARRAMATLKK